MQSQSNSRRSISRVTAERRATVIALVQLALGVLVVVVLAVFVSIPPSPQTQVARLLKGEKIDLSLTTLTNSLSSTNPQYAVRNTAANPSTNLGPPRARFVTDAPPRFVTLCGEKYATTPFRRLAAFPFRQAPEFEDPVVDRLVVTARVLEQIPDDITSRRSGEKEWLSRASCYP